MSGKRPTQPDVSQGLSNANLESVRAYIVEHIPLRDAENAKAIRPTAKLVLDIVVDHNTPSSWEVLDIKRNSLAYVIESLSGMGRGIFPDPGLRYTYVSLAYHLDGADARGITTMTLTEPAMRMTGQLPSARVSGTNASTSDERARRSRAASPSGEPVASSRAASVTGRRSLSASSADEHALPRRSQPAADGPARRSASAGAASDGLSSRVSPVAVSRVSGLPRLSTAGEADARDSVRSGSVASRCSQGDAGPRRSASAAVSSRSSSAAEAVSEVAQAVFRELEAGRRTTVESQARVSRTPSGAGTPSAVKSPIHEHGDSLATAKSHEDVNIALLNDVMETAMAAQTTADDAAARVAHLGAAVDDLSARVNEVGTAIDDAVAIGVLKSALHTDSRVTDIEATKASRDALERFQRDTDEDTKRFAKQLDALSDRVDALRLRGAESGAERAKSLSPARDATTRWMQEWGSKLSTTEHGLQLVKTKVQLLERAEERHNDSAARVRAGLVDPARLAALESDSHASIQRLDALESEVAQSASVEALRRLSERVDEAFDDWRGTRDTEDRDRQNARELEVIQDGLRTLRTQVEQQPATIERIRAQLAGRADHLDRAVEDVRKRTDDRFKAVDAKLRSAAPAATSGSEGDLFSPLIDDIAKLVRDTKTRVDRCEKRLDNVEAAVTSLQADITLAAADGSQQTLADFAVFVNARLDALKKSGQAASVRIVQPGADTEDVVPFDAHGADSAATADGQLRGNRANAGAAVASDEDDLYSAAEDDHDARSRVKVRSSPLAVFDPVYFQRTLPFCDPREPDAPQRTRAVIDAISELYVDEVNAKLYVLDEKQNKVTVQGVLEEIYKWVRGCYKLHRTLTSTLTAPSEFVDQHQDPARVASLLRSTEHIVRAQCEREGEALQFKMQAVIHAARNPKLCSYANTMANYASATDLKETRGAELLEQFIKPPTAQEEKAAEAGAKKRAADAKKKVAPASAAKKADAQKSATAARGRSATPKRAPAQGASGLRASNTVPAPATRTSSKNGRDSP
jgi:hypothetical protein